MGRFVVWVSELDSRLPRKYGREVPRNLAVENPKVSEVVEAAEALKMRVIEVERDKLNPRLAGLEENLRSHGRLIIESRYGKSKSLRLIAQKIREFRKSKSRSKRKRR
ncbi:signal recognition particle protein Srp19 [Thermococcus sp.]